MNAIIRALVVYLVLMVIFRLSGKRTLSQTTPFDFVLLLIISETITQALIDGDSSMTNGLLLALTLVSTSIGMSLLKQKVPSLEKWLDGLPVLVMEKGERHLDRMDKLRVDEGDILEAGRMLQGIQQLDEIEYAVLERSGDITVVPRQQNGEQSQNSAGATQKAQPRKTTPRKTPRKTQPKKEPARKTQAEKG